MFSKIKTAVFAGVQGQTVIVETDITRGLPNICIVGMASAMVMEARERIKSAIINSGYDYPRSRIVVNLTPANIRKNGSYLDLPMAIGILVSSLYVSSAAENYGIIGELSLNGNISRIDGVLPMVIDMYKSGISTIILPVENYNEVKLIEGPKLIPVRSLADCINIINNCKDSPSEKTLRLLEKIEQAIAKEALINNESLIKNEIDFKDIAGQENAKRAIQVAVTGRHGIMMLGPPGCGKTMIARRIHTIMPEMSKQEILETAIVYSVMGNDRNIRKLTERPFRMPHSSIGRAGLLGGGRYPVPGEISLAHNGVLFLDEVTCFDRTLIDALRTPIEEKKIEHFRGGAPHSFPCDFHLIMAANPCYCGYAGDTEKLCKCSQSQLDQYRKKLNGPLIDRVDIRISLNRVDYKELQENSIHGKTSAELREEVVKARAFAKSMGRLKPNAALTDPELKIHCRLGCEEEKLMSTAYKAYKMSARSFNKVLKVSRTIADLDGKEDIEYEHIAEALSYRIGDMNED